MLKRSLLSLCLICTPMFAMGQGVQDRILANLQAEGYHRVQISRTFLGRVRVVAQGGDYRREIVYNPTTGEILRDFTVNIGDDDDDRYVPHLDDDDDHAESGSGEGNNGDNDDEDDDDSDDDNDDDDNGDEDEDDEEDEEDEDDEEDEEDDEDEDEEDDDDDDD